MAGTSLKILCVHGLGDQRLHDWHKLWGDAIRASVPKQGGLTLDIQFLSYDEIFDKVDLTLANSFEAVAKLLGSGLSGRTRRIDRNIFGRISELTSRTAGYVVAWVADEAFQAETRALVLKSIAEHQPDVVLAHSLGSLITYNAFTHPEAQSDRTVREALAKVHYVTFGSQINNAFVVGNLTHGRVEPLAVDFWSHLYNPSDRVFTRPITMLDMPNFLQVETLFDSPHDIFNHDADLYLANAATVEEVWRPIAQEVLGTTRRSGARLAARVLAAPVRKTRQKALLIGINDYPDPANRLEGCVNDVFTMSSVLQDCGFPADTIRVCLNERATRDGILSRLVWLLDDARPGDELVFYYSGHGAQVPQYGVYDEPDHNLETLVPWDFNWEPETFISDDQIYDLYSQLPYDCRLVLIFDCCHAGSMHRDGGARPRGITPPDDIRHRDLKWDSVTQMWVERSFQRINSRFTAQRAVSAQFFGKDGATRRLGRAAVLRQTPVKAYEAEKAGRGEAPFGPYLPLIIEACGEDELSYEYRHGATSHGAFTFSLAANLRRAKFGGDTGLTFNQLVAGTRDLLKDLGYAQTPQVLGPSVYTDAPVPWTG